MAYIYKDKKIGNPALSSALAELSTYVSDRGSEKQADLFHTDHLNDGSVKNADAVTITKLLSDNHLTKSELVRLASIRFSIPRSRLLKLPIDGIKAQIKSALLHEESLKIISQEAERSGSNRMS